MPSIFGYKVTNGYHKVAHLKYPTKKNTTRSTLEIDSTMEYAWWFTWSFFLKTNATERKHARSIDHLYFVMKSDWCLFLSCSFKISYDQPPLWSTTIYNFIIKSVWRLRWQHTFKMHRMMPHVYSHITFIFITHEDVYGYDKT